MSDDGIAPVHDFCVVSSFVKHAYIESHIVGIIDSAPHGTFIGTDDHHMIAVDLQIRLDLQQRPDKLQAALHILKSVQRNRILDPGIMCIKCQDVVHTHGNQFLQSKGTVHGFSAGASVLSALIQKRHNNRNTSCLASHCRNYPFQIGKMVIRRHMIDFAAKRIRQTVIAHINHDIQVVTAHRLRNLSLAFSASEPGSFCFDNIRITFITTDRKRIALIHSFPASFDQNLFHLFHQRHASLNRYQAQPAHRNRIECISHYFLSYV